MEIAGVGDHEDEDDEAGKASSSLTVVSQVVSVVVEMDS